MASADNDLIQYLGPKVAKDIKPLVKLLPQLNKNLLRAILKLLVADCEGKSIDTASYVSLKSSAPDPQSFDLIFSGLYKLLRGTLRCPSTYFKPEYFKDGLTSLGFSEEILADLSSILYGPRRPGLDECRLACIPSFPRLLDMRWRVDVTISTSWMSRVLEPQILLELTTSSGELVTLEVSIAMFHHLRYSVASLLREMGDLEQRNIFKM